VSGLSFEVVGADAERFAVAPALTLHLRVTEPTGTPVHALVLRCQLRIEPQRRAYAPDEEDLLRVLFGERSQWRESLRPFLWTHVATATGGFAGSTEIDLVVPCTYDFEVSGTAYLNALSEGDIPLVLLFSGTVFLRQGDALSVVPVAWHEEASFRLPVAVWREAMDAHFPNSGWIRVDRATLDALYRYRADRALTSWDATIGRLLDAAKEHR
jgi:hypothetical protein